MSCNKRRTPSQCKIIGTLMTNGKNLSSSSKERMKSENEIIVRKFQDVRGRAISQTSFPRRVHNMKRRKTIVYKTGELVAIKGTQAGPGLMFHLKFLVPYCVVKVLRNDGYTVQ
jgi:hypothetical protein